jgi:recombination protein RecA
MAADMAIVTKSGSWYSYGDLRIGQGRENAKQFLKENRDILDNIATEIKKAAGLLPAEQTDAEPGDDE